MLARIGDALRGFWSRLLNRPPQLPSTTVSSLAPYNSSWHDGEKFPGGYGTTQLLALDYWTLRARSAELFRTNHYARGIIRRLITNEINTGLHLEASPEEVILGFEEEALSEWTENIENRFRIWGGEPSLCDHREQRTFGALQQLARMEALLSGDVLVVLRHDQRTRLPKVQLIDGRAVQSPVAGGHPQLRKGHRIVYGVELDELDRQVAYWILQRDLKYKRLPAWGEKSGRRISWLLYGVERRAGDVRGEPLLSLILQSLREIDRYRDSVQRSAVVQSMIAMFIKKTEEKASPGSITGAGAVRRESVTVRGEDGKDRTFQAAEQLPGLVLDQLEQGEEPHGFMPQGMNEKFGEFERAVISSVAWANEIPPEIFWLAFSNNYSASQAAINEFKIYLNKVRTAFGTDFCEPIYKDWLVSEALTRRIDAPGLLEAWRDPQQYDIFGAWVASEWAGHIKPSTDVMKQARGYRFLVEDGFISRDRASRELTGTKFSKNVKKLRRENEQLAEALSVIAGIDVSGSGGSSAPPSGAGSEDPDREDEDEERAA